MVLSFFRWCGGICKDDIEVRNFCARFNDSCCATIENVVEHYSSATKCLWDVFDVNSFSCFDVIQEYV